MYLETTYDGVDKEALWNVLQIYGIGVGFLRVVKSSCINSRAYIREVGIVKYAWICIYAPVNVKSGKGREVIRELSYHLLT